MRAKYAARARAEVDRRRAAVERRDDQRMADRAAGVPQRQLAQSFASSELDICVLFSHNTTAMHAAFSALHRRLYDASCEPQ